MPSVLWVPAAAPEEAIFAAAAWSLRSCTSYKLLAWRYNVYTCSYLYRFPAYERSAPRRPSFKPNGRAIDGRARGKPFGLHRPLRTIGEAALQSHT